MQKEYNDIEIIQAIQQGGPAMEKAMRFVYGQSDTRESVLRFVLQQKGSKEDAEDVFQDGICHLVINLQRDTFKKQSSLKTYLMSICRNIWFQKFNRTRKLNEIKTEVKEKDFSNKHPEQILLLKEKVELLSEFLEKIGMPCKEILSLWGLNYSMREIAKRTGYKNESVMRKKKHQCLKKLITLINAAPDQIKKSLQ